MYGIFSKIKLFLAPKPKNSQQKFATVEFKPSVHAHSQPQIKRHKHTRRRNGTDESVAEICFFASHSEKLTNSIRASCFVRSVFYSRDILKNSRCLFARLSLRAAFSIRETFLKARDLYSRVFLCAHCFLFSSKSSFDFWGLSGVFWFLVGTRQ